MLGQEVNSPITDTLINRRNPGPKNIRLIRSPFRFQQRKRITDLSGKLTQDGSFIPTRVEIKTNKGLELLIEDAFATENGVQNVKDLISNGYSMHGEDAVRIKLESIGQSADNITILVKGKNSQGIEVPIATLSAEIISLKNRITDRITGLDLVANA